MQKNRFFTFTAEWQQLRQSLRLCPLFIFCKKKVTKFASCGVAVSELKTEFCRVLSACFAHISSPYAAEWGHFCSFIASRLPFSSVLAGSLNGGWWCPARMSLKGLWILCAMWCLQGSVPKTLCIRLLRPPSTFTEPSVNFLRGSWSNATEHL